MRKKTADSSRYDEELDHTIWDDILEFMKVFFSLSAVILIFVLFIAKPVVVSGLSMEPTLNNKQIGFSNVIMLITQGVERGNIVVAKADIGNQKDVQVVKRIIGMPGETIEGKDGKIYINGEELDESSYLNQKFIDANIEKYGFFNEDFEPVTLEDDEYFLLGDNRPRSRDSRELGPFNQHAIESKGFLTLIPFEKFGYME